MRMLWRAMEREFKLMGRDGISLYLTFSPALLAVVFLLVFGSLKTASLKLAIPERLPQDMVTRLETIADLETFPDEAAHMERIRAADSVAGVVVRNEVPTLVVEGNEGDAFAASRQAVVSAALHGTVPPYRLERIAGHQSLAYTLSMASILLLTLFIGGAVLGLAGVAERESGAIRALAVSPMPAAGYIAAKLLPALLLGMAGITASTAIMGRFDLLAPLLLLTVCSLFTGGVVLLSLVTFADNSIAAIGVLKILMPLFLVLGISSAFVPAGWHFLYAPLPMYWQFQAISAILEGRSAATALGMTTLTGLAWFAALVVRFTRKVRLRRQGGMARKTA